VAGVGYDTHLLNAKVLDDTGTGFDTWVASGIYWATDAGASVINMSLGRPAACPALLQDAIDYAWARNVVVVAAAGNTGNSDLQAPASCAHVISVASTNHGDAPSWFTTRGTWVTVAAPGEWIVSANKDGVYEKLSGTSMAAPHVSGLAGLVWASSYGTSAQAVFDQLTRTADRVPFTGQFWQYGRVNAAAALGAPPSTPTPTLPPSNIRGWGSNQWGRLTDPVDQYVRMTPAPMLGPGEVSAVAAGSSMTLALATDGTVWASGSGLKGRSRTPGHRLYSVFRGLHPVHDSSAAGARIVGREGDRGRPWCPRAQGRRHGLGLG
jgi:hypothetical protein